ncbi:MAG: hypothetical protein E7641_03270 [Ruminococcaceae bacterium]|nr:hypothetical protein [Oscillospiraceae bacterium]
MSNKKFDFFNRIEELPSRLYIILAIVLMATHTAICAYTEINAAGCGLFFIFIYAVISVVIFLLGRRKMAIYKAETRASEEQNSGVITAFRDHVDLPYAVITENGKIVTVNAAMKEASGDLDTYFNLDINDICDLDFRSFISEIEKSDELQQETEDDNKRSTPPKTSCMLGGRKFDISCHPVHSNGHVYYMMVFNDITKLTEITDLHFAETPAVAYIVIDNLDELANQSKGSYREEASKVGRILKDFANGLNAVIREYDRDKYIMFLNREALVKCIKNKFSVLDDIRNVRIDDDTLPVTVSMGVAITGKTLMERERDALSSLDLALQRGGDQVVVKNEKGVNFFGGLTKGQQKRTRVHSRMVANKLYSEVANASNVIVMGHGNPDFDSIGACIGVARLAMHLGTRVRVVIDKENTNFLASTEKLLENEEYKHIFIDAQDGLEECEFGTLLVIVDANNFTILEAPEIAEKSNKTFIIDHHIKKEEFKTEPLYSFIDPSASSACELVSEILEQSIPVGTLTKEEATILLSGIMVDTKNFTRTVGTRTFSAALYLRGAGANTEIARTFFNEAFEDYRAEAVFGARVEIYRDQLAITTSEGTGSPHDRIAAAKASDKLLTVREVNAAFALVKIGEVIHVSARSNGTINVQLILEKIGGGGHFDMAGASVSGATLEEAKKLIKNAIDEYLTENGKK